MSGPTLTGSCDCGRIGFTSTAPPKHLDFCYCLTCQRLSGAPFIAWTGVEKTALTWHGDTPKVYRPTVGDADICVSDRTFCGSCGSNLTIQYYFCPHKTHIAAAAIQKSDFEIPTVGCHIWCKRTPSWYTIPDDRVERYEEFDEEFQQMLDRYLKEKGDGTS